MNAALFPDLVVNGETIAHTVVAAETQHHEAPRGKPGIAWRKAAKAIAIRTLLLQEAQSRGLAPAREEVGPGRFETDEEALIRGLLDQEIDPQPPSADAVRQEWEANQERFRSPPLWEVSHILCACDPRDMAERTKAQIRADGLMQMLAKRPKGFAALAGQESDCGSKSNGGSLGQLGPGDTVPEFETALRQLSEGETSAKPVLTRHGYHIIRLDALAAGAMLPFSAVSGKISDAMEKQAWALAAKVFVDKLVAAAEISGVDLNAEIIEVRN